MSETQSTVEHLNEEEVRLQKLETYRQAGVEPFAYSFTPTHKLAQLTTDYAHLESGESMPKKRYVSPVVLWPSVGMEKRPLEISSTKMARVSIMPIYPR